MPEASTKTDRWLTLNQAAQRLGVHPTTLRRWADGGEIQVLLTPGGHRRFLTADLDRFAEERRRLQTVSDLEQMWADQALDRARQELQVHRDERWLAAFDERERERKRALGRRLMGIILRYVSLSEGGDDLLAEARTIGDEHAVNALGLHLALTDALEAALFFRDALVEAAIQLPETAHLRPEVNTRLLRRINTVLNAVQLAIAERYDQARK